MATAAELVAAPPDPAHGCVVADGVRLVVETAPLGGADGWTDRTSYATGVDVQLGATVPYGRRLTGQATVTLDDPAGLLDPWAGDPLEVTVWRMLRVVLADTVTGRWWPLFAGVIDSVRRSYSPAPVRALTVRAFDLGSLLATDRAPFVTEQWAGDTTTARVGRLLDRAGWQFARKITGPSVPLLGTTVPAGHLEELHRTAAASGGVFWVDPYGTASYLPAVAEAGAVALLTDECGPETVADDRTYGELQWGEESWGSTSAAATLLYDSCELVTTVERILNRAVTVNAAGLETRHDDATSQARYGVRANGNGWPLIGALWRDLIDGQALANDAVTRYARAVRYVDRLEARVVDGTSSWWRMAGRLLPGRRVNIARTGWADPFELEAVVHGVRYRLTPNRPNDDTPAVLTVTLTTGTT